MFPCWKFEPRKLFGRSQQVPYAIHINANEKRIFIIVSGPSSAVMKWCVSETNICYLTSHFINFYVYYV